MYLHIGIHKTGTTSIQMALHAHRDELLNAGVLYPSLKKDYNHRESAEYLQSPGLYDFQVKLPENFLTPGEYHLGAEIVGLVKRKKLRTLFRLDHSAQFDVYDNGSQLSLYNIPWQGMVHADVEWKKI